MRTDRYPILEFDPEAEALIEPVRLIERIELPPHAVACFFQDVIAKLVAEHEARPVAKLESEIGESWVYEIASTGSR